MVETRITNKVFFSNAVPRVPVIDSSVPPVEDPTSNPTPDVGQPTGTAIITPGTVPNITRVAHSKDIYVALGTTMSISYLADDNCTLLPKGGYEDMVVTYSTDGRTMTLTWACPVDEPADSTYIGVEVWVHGDTSATEAYAVHWDRLHVGKTVSDLKYIGKNTSRAVLYPALADHTDYNGGDTLIISNGTYSATDDSIAVGYTPTGDFNLNLPNGVVELITYEGESFYSPIKHTNVMAEDPLGVYLDRQDRAGGVTIRGDARTGPHYSNRTAHGINVLGIDCLNHPNGFEMERTDSCSINYSASVQDANRDDISIPFGDGSNHIKRATRNCNYEYTLSFGNQRLLNLDSNGDGKGIWRGIFATNGATQVEGEHITQTFTGYGAVSEDWLNCWAIDGGLFAGGIRNTSNGTPPFPNAVFITTNTQGHEYYGEGLLALNTVRAGVFSHEPSPANIFKSCVFWQKLSLNNSQGNEMNTRPFISRGTHQFANITMGKNLSAVDGTAHMFDLYGASSSSFDKCLVVNPIWDRPGSDTLANPDGGNPINQFSDLYIVSESSSLDSEISSSANFQLSTALPKDLGFHYISRIEPDSVLAAVAGTRGCQELFPAVGRYGKRYTDESREVYNGTGGRPRVNKMARSPWFEFRKARKRYSCSSNGQNWSGDVGIAQDGVHPVDYVNRFGTDPSTPQNCPYIDDIYGVVNGTDVLLFWRPVCAAYRGTITSYSLYIDNALYIENISPTTTSYLVSGVSAGARKFEIVCVDPTHGNSGKSTPVPLTV